MTAPAQYPELPSSVGMLKGAGIPVQPVYIADQMRAYVDAAREQDRARAAAPPPAVGVTDEQIDDLAWQYKLYPEASSPSADDVHAFARAVLALRASKPEAPAKVLAEHSGCGSNPQWEQVNARLHPGDKVVLVLGPYSRAVLQAQQNQGGANG